MQTVDSSELAILRALVEGTVQTTGEDFLRSLVRHLCIAAHVANGFIAEFTSDKTRVRSLAGRAHINLHRNNKIGKYHEKPH